jgi:hypothetical protein
MTSWPKLPPRHIDGWMRMASASIDLSLQKRHTSFLTIVKILVYKQTILRLPAANTVVTAIGMAEAARHAEHTGAGCEYPPICHVFHDDRPSSALPFPGKAATPHPLTSPSFGTDFLL